MYHLNTRQSLYIQVSPQDSSRFHTVIIIIIIIIIIKDIYTAQGR